MTKLKIKMAAIVLSMIATGINAQTLSQAQRWFTQGEF